jgi:hypothetical protein
MVQEDQDKEAVFGPAAQYSEHKRGERITYRLTGETGIYTGTIVWVAAPGAIDGTAVGVTYVVERDGAGASIPDVVFPSDVLS